MISKTSNNKKAKLFSDFELHEGWIELCKNEKRQLINSIKQSMKLGIVRDQKRAEKILNVQLDHNSDSEIDNIGNSNRDSRFQESSTMKIYQSERMRREAMKHSSLQREVPFDDLLAGLKSDFYLALEETRMGYTKKKKFTKNDTRCLQSKINLKFPIKDMLKDKPKPAIQIKEGVIEDFEKHYKEMCNPYNQRKKNRDVSPSSPFDKNNMPPKQYLEYDYELPNNPTKQNPKDIDISQVPLAGRLSEVGQKILTLGKKANYITTLDWGVAATNSPKNADEKQGTTTFNQAYGKFNFIPQASDQKPQDSQGKSMFPKIRGQSNGDRIVDIPNYNSPRLNSKTHLTTYKKLNLTAVNSPNNKSKGNLEIDIHNTSQEMQIPKISREDFLKKAKEIRKNRQLQRIEGKREEHARSVNLRVNLLPGGEGYSGAAQRNNELFDEQELRRKKILESILQRSSLQNIRSQPRTPKLKSINNHQQ